MDVLECADDDPVAVHRNRIAIAIAERAVAGIQFRLLKP